MKIPILVVSFFMAITITMSIFFYKVNDSFVKWNLAKEAMRNGYSQKVIFSRYYSPIVIWVKDSNEVGYSIKD